MKRDPRKLYSYGLKFGLINAIACAVFPLPIASQAPSQAKVNFDDSWGKDLWENNRPKKTSTAPSSKSGAPTFYSLDSPEYEKRPAPTPTPAAAFTLSQEPNVAAAEIPLGKVITSLDELMNAGTGPTKPDPSYTTLIAQSTGTDNLEGPPPPVVKDVKAKTILINFNNVSVIEFIRFISRISNKNFVFNDEDLQFNVTIVSEEPTSIEDMLTALLQELKARNLLLIEQGNNLLIHRNATVKGISEVVGDGVPSTPGKEEAQLVTRVFRLNTVIPSRAEAVIRPITSQDAQINSIDDSGVLIVTDLKYSVDKVAQLLKSIDGPANGLVIGQYLVVNAFLDSIIYQAQSIMAPIAQDKSLQFVPNPATNSIFVVSTPFLVERTLAVLSYLDQNVGATRILTPDMLNFPPAGAPGAGAGGAGAPFVGPPGAPGPGAGYERNAGTIQGGGAGGGGIGTGSAPFREEQPQGVPSSTLLTPIEGVPGALGTQGNAVLPQVAPQLPPGVLGVPPPGAGIIPRLGLPPGAISAMAAQRFQPPPGHLEHTQFSLIKLRYRQGDQIVNALGRIAQSLQQTEHVNQDLLSAINSLQWIESSNSLVLSGTQPAILKIQDLIAEIDTPLRQVFIEMLVLQTTLTDSLRYGVNWAARFGGGDTAGAEAFLSGASTLTGALDTTAVGIVPDATSLATNQGFNLGVIGRTLTHNGTEFASIGALISAIRDNEWSDVILTPKILTEDNSPATIFVGINTQFKTQSIANDRGTILTNNFEFRDIGARLTVTPMIGSDDIITLIIDQEISRDVTGGINSTSSLAQQQAGPTTSRTTTKTRVHVPDGYFLIISGMIQDETDRVRVQVPCLGSVPILEA